MYKTCVKDKDKIIGVGEGPSLKDANQNASKDALKYLKILID